MAPTPPVAHFIFASSPFWGHSRPQLYLAFSLLEMFPSLHITFLVAPVFAPNIPKETAFFGPSEDVRSRIRVEPLGQSGLKQSDWEPQYLTFLEDLKPWLLSLPPESSQHDSGDGFSKRPTLAVVDILLAGWTDAMRQLADDPSHNFSPIRSLAYGCGPAAWTLWRMTRAPSVKRFKALKEDPNNVSVPVEDLLRQAFMYTDGSVMEIEGVGKTYDYELVPQAEAVPFDGHWLNFVFEGGAKIRNFSGLVLSTPPDIEPGLQRRIAEELNGICLHVGPQFPPSFWAREATAIVHHESIEFLDDCEKRFGANSVVYISFGSLYSPSQRPDLLETLIESLLSTEPPLPFLLATATIGDVISDRVRKLVSESGGKGLITGFAPQLHVLQHPATGWFLTHGGAGSITESIINRVPMVLWPCMTDQPIASMNLTLNWKLAFELIQVRTGPGAGKPTYRGIQHENSIEAVKREMAETWKLMRGPEGRGVRERVNQMGENFEQSWKNGLARENMRQFEQFF
ncbi:uncharacterized protein EI90DRAFT_3126930 [Cantharellus anzutake]|uniref:uncharacterized protein n=1 Tax=Cantharellus anzutake TaxID=1750568 RepID=UPI001903F994|nr:uncharacterized protein EI90DRAFT_3126930 [Cantharellus anzutake]KAF8327593.1 hypothetical protein EI90DRAFT_3126930 [Cantharellus anzutake]